MTFEQYIVNPMGRSNAVLNATARESIRKDYLKRYDQLLVREKGKIDYKLYYDEKKNIYVAHFKIPSETIEKFYYETVIEFYTNSDVKQGGVNLMDYDVKFYSNDPAFVFTYAHTFQKTGLFINELKSKMSKLANKKEAKEKNPGNNVGYVKSIYFAYLTLKRSGIINRDRFVAESSKLNFNSLAGQIEDAEKKVDARIEAGTKKQHKKTKERKENKSTGVAKVTNTIPKIGIIGSSKNSIGKKNNFGVGRMNQKGIGRINKK